MVKPTMKIPCEIIVWYILPAIRKEFAKALIKNHDLTQKKVADKLGITEAAVSRYLSGKRGRGDLAILNKEIIEEIRKSTDQIIKGNDTTVVAETCRICNLLKSSKIMEGICYACRP
jgi:hypothetical protein